VTAEKADESLDLRGVLCPINFVKTKLKLEELAPGQHLEVLLDAGDPIANVPRSLKEEGHQVLKVGKEDGGYYRLLVKKS
jgi:tRNA 2-thiouridine synthesizing protein A